MSDPNLSRRTEINIEIGGADVSEDINKYLLSFSYTDFEEDNTDDLRIELDDRDGVWLEWFKERSEAGASAVTNSGGDIKIGDVVEFSGGFHYVSSVATVAANLNPRTAGTARVTNVAKGALHPIHLIGVTSNVYGWVDEQLIVDGKSAPSSGQPTIWSGLSVNSLNQGGGDIKGLTLSATIIQRNFDSGGASPARGASAANGKDRVLDCGVFEIDSLDASGPPSRVSIKATSLPHASTVRVVKKNKAWENIKLSAIANEIANKNGMTCMFLSSYDPLYGRREQIQLSDILFLQGLCNNAGISIKVTDSTIVLFDESEFEKKAAVREITKGKADVKTYRFSTSLNDTKYSKCRVSYTNPTTRETIEYTYTPREADADGVLLEINEKVSNREEARQLAMKRLRQKNKGEYQAEFTLVGDTGLVAGVTVLVSGFGVFDGKYIIQKSVFNVTNSGFTTQVSLHRACDK